MNLTASQSTAKLFGWTTWTNTRLAILLAPVLFFVHILEETPGFIRWLNSISSSPQPEGGFLLGNLPFLLITTVLAAGTVAIQRKGIAIALLVWLSYIMFANTLFHVAATVVLGRYCPGLVTALALYLPFYVWCTAYLGRTWQIRGRVVGGIAALASLLVYQQWHTVLYEAARRQH